jgi:N-acetylglucosamine-6-phosphate deacetylase
MMNENILLTGGGVVTPQKMLKSSDVVIEDGIIKMVTSEEGSKPDKAATVIDCRGKIVFPGFIDVHTHGGAGFDFKDEDEKAYDALSAYYYRHGVTSVLATLVPLSHKLLFLAVRKLAT